MALTFDELENNPFYVALETTYLEKYEEALRKLWLICVPVHNSLKGIQITKDFVDSHILKPSPFFKSHFVTTDANNTQSFEIEDGVIKTEKGIIKVLREENAYNNDYKPYRILITEGPLSCSSQAQNENRNDAEFTNKWMLMSLKECTRYLTSFFECAEVLESLDKKIRIFNSSYIVLPQYLQDASGKLGAMLDWTVSEFLRLLASRSPDVYSKTEISSVLENYILFHVHDKVFTVIRNFCSKEDRVLSKKLCFLYEAQVTPDQLGVRESFCCQTPNAVVELASLNSRNNPAVKLSCLMLTLELLNQDISQFTTETSYPITTKDVPYLTSDDLIPLLVYVIVQARPQHFVSNLFYIQNFCLQNSPIEKLSFGLVTFQAAKEYLMSNEFAFLEPSKRNIKKELSLEELMGVTIEMQNNDTLYIEKKPNPSPTDHLLKNVTKMIEASTKDLVDGTQVQDLCHPKQTLNSAQENVGNFFSSLRQSSLGLSFGKQT